MARFVGATTLRILFPASGVTSFPIPSPGITAIRAAAPPLRMGTFAKNFLLIHATQLSGRLPPKPTAPREPLASQSSLASEQTQPPAPQARGSSRAAIR